MSTYISVVMPPPPPPITCAVSMITLHSKYVFKIFFTLVMGISQGFQAISQVLMFGGGGLLKMWTFCQLFAKKLTFIVCFLPESVFLGGSGLIHSVTAGAKLV